MVAGRPQCWAPLPPSLAHRGGEGGDGAPPYRAGPPLGRSECPDQGSHGSSWFARLHLLTRVCSCTDMSVCVLEHTCAHAHTCLQAHVDMNTQVPTCIFVCLPVCPCVSVFTGTCADVYAHMCAHVPSHMHTRAHLHVCMCPMCAACLHMCVCACACVSVWNQRILSSFTQGTCRAGSETPVSPTCWTRAVSNKKRSCFGHLLRKETWIREAVGSWGGGALPREMRLWGRSGGGGVPASLLRPPSVLPMGLTRAGHR